MFKQFNNQSVCLATFLLIILTAKHVKSSVCYYPICIHSNCMASRYGMYLIFPNIHAHIYGSREFRTSASHSFSLASTQHLEMWASSTKPLTCTLKAKTTQIQIAATGDSFEEHGPFRDQNSFHLRCRHLPR